MARRVTFSEDGARRIVNAVRGYERGNRDQPPIKFRDGGDDGGVRLGKTTAAWNKGTLATIEIYEKGTPPNETRNDEPYTLENCVNKFANVASGKWVMVAQMTTGRWYLIAAEC